MKETLYLLTGAAGFLGNNISHSLVAQGKKLRVFVLNGDPAAKYVPKEAEIIYGDLVDKASLEPFFDAPEDTELIVIHCASIVTTSPEPRQIVYDVNVTGTQNIVDLCLEKNVKKLVYVSSTGAITEPPAGQVIKEPQVFEPDKLVGYYAQTKAMATQYVLDMIKSKDLNASIVYPSGICGPNDGSFGPFTSFVIKYCNGQMPVGVEGTFNSVDVRDLAEGVIAAIDKGQKGEGYILSNELVSMSRMFKLISDASGVPLIETILTPAQMEEMAKKNMPGGSMAGEQNIAALKFEMYNLVRKNDFNSDKARQELGYVTRPFEETIADTVAWLRSEGKIK